MLVTTWVGGRQTPKLVDTKCGEDVYTVERHLYPQIRLWPSIIVESKQIVLTAVRSEFRRTGRVRKFFEGCLGPSLCWRLHRMEGN